MAGLFLWSCAVGFVPASRTDRPSVECHLFLGESLLARGDYAGARVQAEHVLEHFPGHADDQALYLMGMVLIHPDNPQGDPREAAAAFRRLVVGSPDSPLVAGARTWLALIADLEHGARAAERLKAQNQTLREQLDDETEKRLKLEERLQQMKAVDLTVE
jgi:hypothetical protein